ncbi:CAAX protease self-immunity [Bacteroidetes bacterium oral taxon 272 str. F0290]|nr:CAAX protease self-immunity [Bacteroidetes bacterium oral taxon 272 str. F0290]
MMDYLKNTFRTVIVPVKLIFYYLLYQLGSTYAVTFLLAGINKFVPITEEVRTIYATSVGLVLSGVLMIVHLILFEYIKFNRQSWKEVSPKTVFVCLPLIISALISSNIANEVIALPDLFQGIFFEMSRNIFGLLSMAIVAPIVEEMLFRGGIEGFLLRRGLRPAKAICLSALLFGLTHVNPAQVIFALFLGLIFGWLYYRTGSIIPSMAGHMLNNSVAAVLIATSSMEEMGKTTADILGNTATYFLWAVSISVLIASFLYLKKYLPPSPFGCSDRSAVS